MTLKAVNERTQFIEQAAAAGVKGEVYAGKAEAQVGSRAEAKAGGVGAAGGGGAKTLPATGGTTPLVAVGTGAALLGC